MSTRAMRVLIGVLTLISLVSYSMGCVDRLSQLQGARQQAHSLLSAFPELMNEIRSGQLGGLNNGMYGTNPLQNQYGQVPNQFGQVPNQFGQMPNQLGQLPNQFGQLPNQGGLMPNQQVIPGQTVGR